MELLFPLILDHAQHGLGISGLFQGLAKFGLVQNLGDVGEGVKMLLKLALGHQEKHDEVHWLVVKRVKVDTVL
jgi:hypothetical protein